MSSRLLRSLPLAILALGALFSAWLMRGPASAQPAPHSPAPPPVDVVVASLKKLNPVVRTQGTVEPRTEIELVSETAGVVRSISPAFVAGGHFENGEALVKLDARDAHVALDRAEAALSRHRSELKLARHRLERLRALERAQVASRAELEDVESEEQIGRARLREAEAVRDQALRELDKTRIRVSFSGHVRTKTVDVGQFVSRGSRLGRIYADDYAEIRLPIPDAELAYLELPQQIGEAGPIVRLSAPFAGKQAQWTGTIVRSEGEIAARSRMVTLVARVKDPFASSTTKVPLTVGLFVQAEILGRPLSAIVIPRSALLGKDRVLVVGEEGWVSAREVEVLRIADDRVFLGGGIESGERLCASAAQALEGTQVEARVADPSVMAGLPR